MFYDVHVIQYAAMKNQRNLRASGDLRALLETHWGPRSVKEHRGGTLFYDVHVVQSDALKNQRNPRVSGDQKGSF